MGTVILVTVLLVAISSSLVSGDGDLHVFALPVGQGDATVIKCPDYKDGKSIVPGKLNIIDMGSSSCTVGGCMNTEDDIKKFIGNNKVDNIFLTHPDTDHYKLMPALASKLDISGISEVHIYHTYDKECYQYRGKTPLEDILQIKNNNNINNVHDHLINRIGCRSPNIPVDICNKKAKVVILAAGLGCGGTNADSLVLQLQYFQSTMLFVGDLEGEGVKELLKCHNNYSPAKSIESNVLRLSHHGSRHNQANSDNFLKAVLLHNRMMYAFSSSDPGHQGFRHPNCEIKEWFERNFVASISFDHEYLCNNNNAMFYYTNLGQRLFQTTGTQNGGNLQHYILQMTVDSNTGLFKSMKREEYDKNAANVLTIQSLT